jgi:hypothetical protein
LLAFKFRVYEDLVAIKYNHENNTLNCDNHTILCDNFIIQSLNSDQYHRFSPQYTSLLQLWSWANKILWPLLNLYEDLYNIRVYRTIQNTVCIKNWTDLKLLSISQNSY